MTVNTPQIEYEVATTIDEDAIISECLAVLENITDTMKSCHCDTLDYGYPESPETISIEDIGTITHILYNLKDIHTMY